MPTFDESLKNLYERISKISSQKDADALVQERTNDVMSWKCWCVTPSHEEANRVARSDLTAIVSFFGTPEELTKAEEMFNYKLPK